MKTGLLIGLLSIDTGLAAETPRWPQFRGPNGSDVAEDARPPVHFGPETNLLWKTPVPPGLSAPLIWGGRVFLTALENRELITLANDARTGRELWRSVAPAKNVENCHEFSSPAASTLCTDGERVYAYFGSFGLIAYDFDGKKIWRRTLERLPSKYGTASSPILAGGQLILRHDSDGTNASLIAFAPNTGKTVWESPRPLAGGSYSTPMVRGHEGLEELIFLGRGRVPAYSLTGGPPKWWVNSWGGSAAATIPAIAGDTLYVRTAGHLWAFAENQNQDSARARTAPNRARLAPNGRGYAEAAATRD